MNLYLVATLCTSLLLFVKPGILMPSLAHIKSNNSQVTGDRPTLFEEEYGRHYPCVALTQTIYLF
jgi:hypothetical protein